MNTTEAEKKPEFVRSGTNGLANWRKRIAEDKVKKMAELEVLRESGTTTERDGKEYVVVSIPDNYGWGNG